MNKSRGDAQHVEWSFSPLIYPPQISKALEDFRGSSGDHHHDHWPGRQPPDDYRFVQVSQGSQRRRRLHHKV